MADKINVNRDILKQTATKFRGRNDLMDEKLNNINNAMQGLQEHFDSDSGVEIRANMDALKPRFQQYKDVIESYAKFLDTTADTYGDTEDSLRNMASQFK